MKITIGEKAISRSDLSRLNTKMLSLVEVLTVAMIHADNELNKNENKNEKEIFVLNLHFRNVLEESKRLILFLERSIISDILN
jgi:hypothetical protein